MEERDKVGTAIMVLIIAVLLVALIKVSTSSNDCQSELQVKKQEALKECVEKNKTTVLDLINYCKFTTKGSK